MSKFIKAGLFAVGVLVSATASAVLPASVTTAVSDTSTDAATLGGLVLALIVGIAVFKHLRSAK